MTKQEYDAICARIDKAESLPEDAMREPYVRRAYHDLCDQAAEYERCVLGCYFEHSIHDATTRDIVRQLMDDLDDQRDICDSQIYARGAQRVFADLLALASTPDERVLEIFGYKPAADD